MIIEGSNEPRIDSDVFLKCAESSEGERLLLGTAEAGRYRSIAAAALAYDHSLIQSPIDVNLAKQLNIMLKEIGVKRDHIIIDPYTGALGYGFEYSYSAMERIRFSALKGATDLAMPMISAAIDSLSIKEVREAEPEQQDEMAVVWEFYSGIAAAVAGAGIICVRHPKTVGMLKSAFADLRTRSKSEEKNCPYPNPEQDTIGAPHGGSHIADAMQMPLCGTVDGSLPYSFFVKYYNKLLGKPGFFSKARHKKCGNIHRLGRV